MRGRRERGFALLIVLWSLVIIALLFTQIVASGRTAVRLAGNLRQAAVAQACADGALNETLLHVISTGPEHWAADGSVHLLACGGLAVTVRSENLASRINPNLASTALLAGLFQAVGASAMQAGQLAGAIIAWRSPAVSAQAAQQLAAQYRQAGLRFAPPARPFADVSELGDVLGMPPALLAAARPYLSLYASGDPDPSLSAPVVRRALSLAGQTGSSADAYNGAATVVVITAQTGGTGVRRQAIVSIAGAGTAVPFRMLALTGGY